MKRIILLLFVTFSLNSFSQTISEWLVIPSEYLANISIECDGVSDLLTSMSDVDLNYHVVEHYDKKMDNVLGVRWSRNQGHNTLISAVTGEIFECHEINHGDISKGTWKGKLVLKGNMGSHYHVTMLLSWTDVFSWPTLIDVKYKCL